MKDKKIEIWRIAVAIISIVFIAYMWLKKGMVSTDISLPLMVTSFAVTLTKIGFIALGVFLLNKILSKIKK